MTSVAPSRNASDASSRVASSDTITFDYSNWAFDLPMPESFFEVPSDIDVESLDYEFAQGFLYSRPVEASRIVEMLQDPLVALID